MNTPTVDDIKAWSLVDWSGLPEVVSDELLEVFLARSVDYVLDVTGRTLDSVPAGLVTTAQEAIQKRVEQLAYQAQPDQIDTRTDDMVKSFGTDGFNESRRDLNEPDKQKMINPWQALHDLLWRLATEEKRDEWMERWGSMTPAFEVAEVDWGDFGAPVALPGGNPADEWWMPGEV